MTATATATEPSSPRLHGDSYSDVAGREVLLVTTTSTHVPSADRRPEEPSEPSFGAERLEDDA